MHWIVFTLLVVIGLSGCGAKHNPNGSYERANSASEKALEQLDRD